MKRMMAAMAAVLMLAALAGAEAPVVGEETAPEAAVETAEPLFPDLDGFSFDGEERRHDPVDLFEYIDGKADGYLEYAFEELMGIDYRRKAGGVVAVDVYRHATPEDAYGIFSSERPADAVDAGIGAAGYAEPGHFNFVKGVYYVKIAGRELGKEESEVLAQAAARMAGALAGDETLPATVGCFPAENRVANSVRYVTEGFLGHSFLHRAFVAEYETETGVYRAFVLEGADAADRDAMLNGYLDLVRRKGGEVVEKEGMHRFYDPYRTYEGVLNLRVSGTRLLGVFENDVAAAEACLDALEANLPKDTK